MENQLNQENTSVSIKGLLINIDGVLCVENRAIQGAVEAIEYLQEKEIPFLLITNTTRRSRFSLHTNLQHLGFRLNIEQIFSAPYVASQWLKAKEVDSISLFLQGDAYREFQSFRITNNNPEYVVIGDIGEDLTYNYLNQAFRLIYDGARILALQKNRHWLRKDGPALDTGAIVAALEYSAQKKATVVGKPSLDFFHHAAKKIGILPEDIAIIGDDLEADIKGGAQAGFYSIAVETGKLHKKRLRKRGKLPHHLLPSIENLPQWLEEQKRVL